MGAVLHTLNLRLFPEQLAYVVNHAEDQVIMCDASIAGLLARVRDQIPTVRHIVVVGEGDTSALGDTLAYEDLLAAEEPGYDWPRFDERQAAAMCYTSGTTGNPKGVVYSHRSTFLHSMAITAGSSLGISERDSILSIVPMFHANAWGTPYGGVHDRRGHDHAAAVPPGRTAGRHHRPPPSDRLRRGARPSGAISSATPSPTRSTCRPCA